MTPEKELKEFAESEETKKAIQEAFNRSEKSIEALRKARKLDFIILNTPVTI